jgi:filamentous hemagglutinin
VKNTKPPLKKGEVDEYGNLQKKTGDGTIHRDHQPSKAALLKRAEKLKGSPLTKGEIKRINKEATAVNVPEDIHRAGPTYGGKNKDLIEPDSNDLAGATKRDSDAMVDNAKNMDTENVNVYEEAADNVTKKDNAEYDDWLLDRLDE